jgi:hypothetical protein
MSLLLVHCFAGESPLMTTTGISESESMLHHISPRASDAELLKLRSWFSREATITATWKLSGPKRCKTPFLGGENPVRFAPGAFLRKPTFRWDEGVRFGAALSTTAALLAHLNLEVQEFDSHLRSLHQSRSNAYLLSHAYPCLPYVSLCCPSTASQK